MIRVTQAALLRLKALILEHPDDPVVRVGLKDLNEHHLVFSITLEDRIEQDDVVQDCDGLTIAVSAASAARMDEVTLDYREPGGFSFQHPTQEKEPGLFGKSDLN
jgi:Fe-S cluster assembly iron-binding protein IscA